MIRVTCPKCKAVNKCAEEDAGRLVTCSGCEEELRVPDEEKKASPDLDDLEVVSDESEEDRPKKKKKKGSGALGSRRATFKPNKGLMIVLMVGFAILGAAGAVFLVLTIAKVLTDGGVALAMFTLPTGVIGFLWCLSAVSLKVALHEGGLVHTKFGKSRQIAWEDILAVKQAITEVYTNGAYSGTTYRYALELEDGTSIVYTNYRLQKVEKLGGVIVEKTTEVLLPQAIRRYEKGKVVEFGKLGVSEKGLHYGSSLLKWKEISGVKLEEGYVKVSKRGKWLNWCNIAVASIPNPYVFLNLVNSIVGLDD
jgi:hypothetical protein